MKTILFLLVLITPLLTQGQQIIPLSDNTKLQPVNREFTIIQENPTKKTILHMDARPDAGIVWIKDLNFSTGTIEFDVKGKDVLQQSFIGIAYHGINDNTYESIYFRPFNFQSADPARKSHAVQYISLPQYDWNYLRQKYPGKYENALQGATNPNEWFHVKIIIEKRKAQAFVNGETQPSLTVEPLTAILSGKIGFWVGNGSDGDFANLVVENY